MKTRIALGFLTLLVLAASPAAALERDCRPSLSNLYHCPEPSAPAKKSAPTTSTSSRECHPSLSNGFSCPGPSQEGRRSAPQKQLRARSEIVDRASRTVIIARGHLVRPPLRKQIQHRIADAGRACRTGSTALPLDNLAPTNMNRKRWPGCIASMTPLSGLTPDRISTTSAAPPITAPPKPGPTCVSRPRSLEAYALRRMKSILEPSRGL